jgi:hypothetical protein
MLSPCSGLRGYKLFCYKHNSVAVTACLQAFHTCSYSDSFVRYETAIMICASMKAAVKFLKNHDKLERESFVVLDESLPSLTFHGNLAILKHCVEIAVNKLCQ